MTSVHVLFICWGNICRSPTAEGILRRAVERAGLTDAIGVDSAGVSDEHEGAPPDRRTATEAEARGLDLRSLRARPVTADDWDRFDLLLVADDLVERRLRRDAPSTADPTKVARITDFVRAPAAGPPPTEVPDPYYGGADGFRLVFDLLEDACEGLLDHLRGRIARSA